MLLVPVEHRLRFRFGGYHPILGAITSSYLVQSFSPRHERARGGQIVKQP